MPHESINPAGITTPKTFSHVMVAQGTKMAFIAGQVAEDGDGKLVGQGDMRTQARQVFANIGRALEAAGARPEHVVRLTIFVAGFKREHLEMIEEGRLELFGKHKPTDTLVGVATLSRPEYMIEVDAIAIAENWGSRGQT